MNAKLRYLGDRASPSVIHAGLTDGTGETNDLFSDVDVPILNARVHSPKPMLRVMGFELVDCPFAPILVDSSDQLKSEYNNRLCSLLRSVTGGSRATVLRHNWRSSEIDPNHPGATRAPVLVVHNDYTASSAFESARPHFCSNSNGACESGSLPFMLLTVWRSTRGAVGQYPIAVCDGRTISTPDLVNVYRHRGSQVHSLQLARYSLSHKWYFYNDMQPEEALVFVCHVSKSGYSFRSTLHSAVNIQSPESEMAPRNSIESRCIVFF